jgi:hypothetical protein
MSHSNPIPTFSDLELSIHDLYLKLDNIFNSNVSFDRSEAAVDTMPYYFEAEL